MCLKYDNPYIFPHTDGNDPNLTCAFFVSDVWLLKNHEVGKSIPPNLQAQLMRHLIPFPLRWQALTGLLCPSVEQRRGGFWRSTLPETKRFPLKIGWAPEEIHFPIILFLGGYMLVTRRVFILLEGVDFHSGIIPPEHEKFWEKSKSSKADTPLEP